MTSTRISKKAKKNYLLLELMIAFFLLSLFLAPLLHSPFAYLRKQQREVTSILLQIEEEKLLASIEENLRNGKISWDLVLEAEKHPISLKTISLKIAQDPLTYSAELSLMDGNFEIEKGMSFGTVKAAVTISHPLDKKKKPKPTTVTLFILKAPPPSVYAAT